VGQMGYQVSPSETMGASDLPAPHKK
jgi:hypothetical protein